MKGLELYEFHSTGEDFCSAVTAHPWGSSRLQIGMHSMAFNGQVSSSTFAYLTLEEEERLRDMLNNRYDSRLTLDTYRKAVCPACGAEKDVTWDDDLEYETITCCGEIMIILKRDPE